MLPTEADSTEVLMTYLVIIIVPAAVVLMGFVFDALMERWDAK